MARRAPLRALLGWALAAAFAALPVRAAAEPFIPRLYDVTGVAANDVLNVRAGPTVSAPIVGVLSPYATRVEVVGLNDTSKWGRIAIGERDGWVSMAYLQRRYPKAEGIPAGMWCFGMQPNWSMRFVGREVVEADHSAMTEARYPIASTRWPHWRAPSEARLYAWSAQRGGRHLAGSIEAGACRDGMSGRPFGWKARIITTYPDAGVGIRTGCCSLAGR